MMRKLNIFLLFCMAGFLANAQETVVNLSMQPGYSQEVFFDFSSGDSENFDVSSWDIAFLRTGDFDFGERVNDGLGIEVYEVSDDPDDWDAVTPAAIDENTPHYYNSDTAWEIGAFDQGGDPDDPFSFGWGNYDPADHHLYGAYIFILKYPDDTYKKFYIEEYFGGYTFKYATWDDAGSEWIDEHETVLPNEDGEGKMFNYYSLSNDEAVTASPDMENWDLVFMKYVTDLGQMYPVQGALQNPQVEVAVNTNADAEEEDLDFSEEINTVGYDWKTYEEGSYTVDPDTYYFLKYEDGTVYRFHFLSYDGSDTGDFSLGYEDVTNQMDVEHFDAENSLSLYPNPSADGNINILFDGNQNGKAQVKVYDINGRLVKQQSFDANGFTNHHLDLTGASSGVYILKFTTDRYTATKKLILN